MPKYASGRLGESGLHTWWCPNTRTGRSASAAVWSSHASDSADTPPDASPGIDVSITASVTPGSVTTSGAWDAKSSPW
jgi:hypothetical protein